MPKRKIILLDIDGVLNCDSTTDRMCITNQYGIEGKYTGVDDDKIDRLRKLVEETDAYIVISSTWRQTKGAMDFLKERIGEQLTERIIGSTPIIGLRMSDRHREISEWLENNDECDFIVIDDSPYCNLDLFEDKFIQTNESIGLTDEDIIKAKKILLNSK